MKFKLSYPFETMSGSISGSDIVFASNGVSGTAYARTKVKPKNPDTPDQQSARKAQKVAACCWTNLSREARADWERFTEMFACTQGRRRALDVCREAQRKRIMLGLPCTTSAPRLSFPGPVTTVAQEAGGEPNEFRFRIEHVVDAPSGYMVQVKMTTEMLTVARTPRARDARCICGNGPASAVALPESGGTIHFPNARFAIAPGARFGVEMTVIRIEDGLASQPAFFDLIRPE